MKRHTAMQRTAIQRRPPAARSKGELDRVWFDEAPSAEETRRVLFVNPEPFHDLVKPSEAPPNLDTLRGSISRLFRVGVPIAARPPQPKGDFDKLPAYRAWVKTHACFGCGAPPPSVCCHQNVGKGQSLKVSDRLTFPLCVTCHEALDNSRGLKREQRRAAERAHVARMQSLARAAGRKEIE